MPIDPTIRVLLVEDSSVMRKMEKNVLQSLDLSQIIEAQDGDEAIKLYKAKRDSINIILMDIKLPKKDGITAAKEIKCIDNSIPIIAQTAYALPEEEHKIRISGFDEYISKPIIKDKLIMLLSMFLS